MTPKLANADTVPMPVLPRQGAYGLTGLHDLTIVDHLRGEAASGMVRGNWERRFPR